MTENTTQLSILLPIVCGLIIFIIPEKIRGLKEVFVLLVMGANLAVANIAVANCMFGQVASLSIPWLGAGIDLSFKIYRFNSFIMFSAAAIGFLVTVFSAVSLFGKTYAKRFYAYLLVSFGLVNGALMADNMVAMLFFWEGLLLTLFAMIYIGNPKAFKTAIKAFIIVGACDLVMMIGIGLAGHISGTLEMSKMSLSLNGLGGIAFLFLIIGAISKTGSMPFHSWIPDAAIDAPLPFMAIIPAAIEKLVGIYFLTKVSLYIFKLNSSSWASYLLMIVGSATIILAVMMALVQKDYKKLLSYHAISQAGYMILGIGTMMPIGIVGGIFHMLNNAIYKSGLFLTGGSVERQVGTTDLSKLGGLGKRMPVTFACFIVMALSISGVPLFNGFFSKELIYEGALERGWIFYLAAIAGSFLTAASFLKLGHAAFLGKRAAPSEAKEVKESPILMLIPIMTLALACILFGIFNKTVLEGFIQPALAGALGGEGGFSGFPKNIWLVIGTVAVLLAALANHIYGSRKTGKGLGAVDHIHYAPILSKIYEKAEAGRLDPYNIAKAPLTHASKILSGVDKANDFIYNVIIVKAAGYTTAFARRIHSGNHKTYIAWSLLAAMAMIIILMRTM